MRTTRLFLGLLEHAGLHVWCLLFIATTISSCSDDKVQIISVDDVVWNFDFSKDGRNMFLVSGWYNTPPKSGNSSYPNWNKISVFGMTEGKLELKVEKPDGEAAHVFSCNTEGVFVTSESDECLDELCGCCRFLVSRDIRLKREISRVTNTDYWGQGISAESNTFFYRCDSETDTILLLISPDAISAVDYKRGIVLREYIAQDIGEYWFFEIQQDADRLLLFDRTNDKIWVWRLSTAEHLGTISVVPGFYDCVIQDADHLVCTGYDPAAQPTATYVVELVDLASLSIERVFPIGNYYPFSHPPFAMRGNRAIVSGWVHDKKSLFLLDFSTGEVTVPLEDFGNLFAMPDLDRVFVTWTDPDTKRRRWSLHSFPDFAEIKTGDDPPPAESVYLAKRKLLLQYLFGHLYIFDPVEGRYLDRVDLCDSGDYWFRVDATERYAGTLCHGDETREKVLRGIRPRGAGVAVVDLSRYFRE